MTLRLPLPAAAIATFLAATLDGPVAHALDCPSASGADKAEAQAIAASLAGGAAFDDLGWLRESIAGLIAKGLPRTVIIDGMIADYCPRVAADAALSETQKTAGLRSFAARITQVAYGGGSEEAVILAVPFTPATVEKIDRKAREAGVSPEAWVAGAVEGDLD
jgi:hypothetical protein